MISNPVLRGFHPDPSWCVVDGEVYLVTSTFNWVPGLPIYRWVGESWQLVGHALPEPGPARLDEAEDSGGIYAPTLRYIEGRFVLVGTSVLPEGSWDRCEGSFIMTADAAEGPWSDPRWIDGAGGIDPDIFEDRDGTVWWAGTRLAKHPLWQQQTEIWVRPFDLESARFAGPESVIWHGAVEGAVWAEGPHLYWKDGWYYLLTAEGGTAEEHSVSVARSRAVRGPWQGCPRNPVFTHRNLGRAYPVQNTGHADLACFPARKPSTPQETAPAANISGGDPLGLRGEADTWWAVMLGVRSQQRHHLLGRETFMCPVTWEDGWPVFAPGFGVLPATVDFPLHASGSRVHSDTWHRCRLDPDSCELIRPVGRAWQGQSFRGVRVSEWDFAMDWKPAENPGAHSASDSGGMLAIVRDAQNWAGVYARGGRWHYRVCRKGGRSEGALRSQGARAFLRLRGLTLEMGTISDGAAVDSDAVPGFSCSAQWLSTESAGGFTGCVMGLWGAQAWSDAPDLQMYV